MKIGERTFLIAFFILLALIVAVGILTSVVPTGSYQRRTIDGKEKLKQDSFRYTNAARLSVYKRFAAPFEALFGADGAVILVIIFFLLAVSMAFSLLEKSDIMSLFILKTVRKFGARKYVLPAVVVFFFMLTGAVLGTFEKTSLSSR